MFGGAAEYLHSVLGTVGGGILLLSLLFPVSLLSSSLYGLEFLETLHCSLFDGFDIFRCGLKDFNVSFPSDFDK